MDFRQFEEQQDLPSEPPRLHEASGPSHHLFCQLSGKKQNRPQMLYLNCCLSPQTSHSKGEPLEESQDEPQRMPPLPLNSRHGACGWKVYFRAVTHGKLLPPVPKRDYSMSNYLRLRLIKSRGIGNLVLL